MEQQEAPEPAKPNRMKFPEKPPPESHREYLDMDTEEEEFGHQETPEPLDEAPPEPDKPQFTTDELDQLELTILPNLSEACWSARCLETIREFFGEPTQLVLTIFFWKNSLQALLGFPRGTDSGLTYFLREPWQVYRADDFLATVSFGSVCERTELAMLKFSEGLYAPLVFKKQHWPTIKKNEIFSNLNEFLTRAIDVTYKPMGMLVLYLPWEGIQQCSSSTREEEAQLINRLEKVARTWIKQIREALANSPSANEGFHHVSGEFDFWQSRYENLACISQQLSSDCLQSIVKQLKRVNSPSVKDLKLLLGKVDESLTEAKSNLIFLDMLIETCKAFTEPKHLQDCLPTSLHVIRFIWIESPYYNIPENIERLLCSLSVYVVKICMESISTSMIFDDPKKCRGVLKMSLHSCHSYKQIYDIMIDSCMKSDSSWKVNKINVFKSIDAFEQRCRDVSDICDAILIYGGLNKINFGGTKGNYHEMQYNRVKDYFSHIINKMRICCDYALNITEDQWFQDMSNFINDLNELESTIKNLFSSLFQEVNNVDMGIETLYTLLKFKERRGFQDMLHDKWTKVWEIFYEEIKLCLLSSINYKVIPDQVKLSQSEESMIKDIYKSYLIRLRKMMTNASDWLGDCDIQSEILSKYP